MATNSADKLSYINTLVFTIIAGIVSIGILCMLFFPIGKRFLVFIVAVEIGIFAIIGYCIYTIAMNESMLRKLRDSNNLVVNFEQCGDYYVRKVNEYNKEICTNNYVITDKFNTKYVMKIYDAEGPDPPSENVISDTVINSFGSGNETRTMNRKEVYDMKELSTASNLTTFSEKCKPFYFNTAGYEDYMNIPWTFAKARCQSFYQ